MADRMVEPILKESGFRLPKKPSRLRARSKRQSRVDWEQEWQANRLEALARDGYRCRFSGCNRPAEVVHHKAGRRVADANRLDRLVSLCDAHHRHVHDHPDWSYQTGFMERHG
jgi:5-methylcytosine-specific restriction endonuclease McrA